MPPTRRSNATGQTPTLMHRAAPAAAPRSWHRAQPVNHATPRLHAALDIAVPAASTHCRRRGACAGRWTIWIGGCIDGSATAVTDKSNSGFDQLFESRHALTDTYCLLSYQRNYRGPFDGISAFAALERQNLPVDLGVYLLRGGVSEKSCRDRTVGRRPRHCSRIAGNRSRAGTGIFRRNAE